MEIDGQGLGLDQPNATAIGRVDPQHRPRQLEGVEHGVCGASGALGGRAGPHHHHDIGRLNDQARLLQVRVAAFPDGRRAVQTGDFVADLVRRVRTLGIVEIGQHQVHRTEPAPPPSLDRQGVGPRGQAAEQPAVLESGRLQLRNGRVQPGADDRGLAKVFRPVVAGECHLDKHRHPEMPPKPVKTRTQSVLVLDSAFELATRNSIIPPLPDLAAISTV